MAQDSPYLVVTSVSSGQKPGLPAISLMDRKLLGTSHALQVGESAQRNLIEEISETNRGLYILS